MYARQKKDSLALVQFAEAYRIDSTSVAVLATYSEFYNERRDYASSLNYTRRLFASDEMPLDDKLTYFDRITGDRNFYSTFYLQDVYKRQALLVANTIFMSDAFNAGFRAVAARSRPQSCR